MKKIANVNEEFILYIDGSTEELTAEKRLDLLAHLRRERVFYSRYIIELENIAETINTIEESRVLNDLARQADSEYTRISNIIDKLTAL